jgi:hypothetical protein
LLTSTQPISDPVAINFYRNAGAQQTDRSGLLDRIQADPVAAPVNAPSNETTGLDRIFGAP